jgi:elongation factor G
MGYETKNIRNICLLGHGSSGKTTLAENMLYLTGAIDRQGKVPDGNTVCDYDAEETRRQFSISAAIAPLSSAAVKSTYWIARAISILSARCWPPSALRIPV